MDGPPIPRRTTDRLILREWRDADRAPFAALNADPRVSEHLSGPLDRAASDALIDRIVARWASDGHGLWAVERREDSRFLGFVGLAAPTFEATFTPCVEVGWRLAPEAWGHGYATEVAREALRFGFEELGLDEIVSFTVPGNARSRAVMERIGLKRDPADDFLHPSFPDGHRLRQHVLYRLRRSDWSAPTSRQVGRARPILRGPPRGPSDVRKILGRPASTWTRLATPDGPPAGPIDVGPAFVGPRIRSPSVAWSQRRTRHARLRADTWP